MNIKIEHGKISPIFGCSISKLDYKAFFRKIQEKIFNPFFKGTLRSKTIFGNGKLFKNYEKIMSP